MKYLKKAMITAVFMCLTAILLTGPAVSAAETNPVKSAKKVSGGSWETDSGGKRYRTKAGRYLKNAWIRESETVYRLDGKGYAVTGWFTWKDNKYFADKTGAVYYSKWYTKGKSRYYFSSDGSCVTSSWKKIKGKYYYFTKTGKMAVNRSVGQYYVNGSGARMISSWVKKDGKYYYYGSNGRKMCKIWIKSSKGFRYVDSDGVMATDQWVGKYYVGSDGYRLTSCEVDGYWLDETGKRTKLTDDAYYIFVGDSRMVGMQMAVSGSGDVFIAQVGSNYSWLQSTALAKLKRYLKKDPKARVVLAFGVNDLSNIDRYIACYRKLVAGYPNTEFYMLSVNPVNDAYLKKYSPLSYSWANNAKIRAFNKKLKSAFGEKYINTYSYLKKTGFSASDGLHYNAATYQKIYKYIKEKTG